jgi:hypothetical protein
LPIIAFSQPARTGRLLPALSGFQENGPSEAAASELAANCSLYAIGEKLQIVRRAAGLHRSSPEQHLLPRRKKHHAAAKKVA